MIVDPAYDRTGDKDSDRPTTRERVESEAARADYEGVSATLLGPVADMGGTMAGATARPDGLAVAAGGGDLNRLLTYVHEALFQADLPARTRAAATIGGLVT